MILKTYIQYILKTFLLNFFKIFFIFFCLIFILNIFEEIGYFKNTNKSIFFIIFMTFLNVPSVLYLITPFIFLIATQTFFMEIFQKDELIVFKLNGLSNIKILNILLLISLMVALMVNILLYSFSSKLQFLYLDFKNQHSKDNKYLAVVTENGLWIKDEIDGNIHLINSAKMEKNILQGVTISVLNKEHKLIKNITTNEVDIKNVNWIIRNAKIIDFDTTIVEEVDKIILKTSLDYKKINSLFSNLSSLSFFELKKLRKSYVELGYSTDDLDVHTQKLYSHPIYMVIMTLLATIIMLNVKRSHENYFYIILGVSISVMIYYIIYLFSLLGLSGRLPVPLSIWLPLILIIMISSIGVVKLNEK
jgi:lipopolysaccharide export system permease protein